MRRLPGRSDNHFKTRTIQIVAEIKYFLLNTTLIQPAGDNEKGDFAGIGLRSIEKKRRWIRVSLAHEF